MEIRVDKNEDEENLRLLDGFFNGKMIDLVMGFDIVMFRIEGDFKNLGEYIVTLENKL